MKNYTPPPTPCKFKEELPIEITYSNEIDEQAGISPSTYRKHHQRQ